MPAKFRQYESKTIDTYLSNLSPDKRVALSKVRKAVLEACPSAIEVISWGQPMFKYKGKYVAAFTAFTHHCAFAPWTKIASLEKAGINLSKYDTTLHMIRFTPEKPLPTELVKKIVRARMKEIDEL